MSIDPEQAPVTPRVIFPETGDELPVDESFPDVAGTSGRPIEMVGGPGSGKTTTLRHLAAVLPEAVRDVTLLDVPLPSAVKAEAARGRVIYTATEPIRSVGPVSYRLAGWSDDDRIAYLLARHPEQCRSVMSRLGRTAGKNLLKGVPALWRVVLDRMANDPALGDVREALRREFPETHREGELSAAIGDYCRAVVARDVPSSTSAYRRLEECDMDESRLRLLLHTGPKAILAADKLAELAARRKRSAYFDDMFPSTVVSLVAERVSADAGALDYLRELLADATTLLSHAFPASVLHAARTGWRPTGRPLPKLARAQFRAASWAGVDLCDAELDEAGFYAADLSGARLDRARADRAGFWGVTLRDASLRGLRAFGAVFTNADLSGADAENASLRKADFTAASLDRAKLFGTDLQEADLTGASCRGADLRQCNLRWAVLSRTDLREADLSGADLQHAKIDHPILAGARLRSASLAGLDLEYLRVPGADLYGADLSRALLTGTFMPEADLRDAKLCEAALADVEWEGADLRGADFSDAVFHMGSSRSGLVDSPLASEGTRTGFYTDDYEEQHFKAPEEIRKGNLCGADLRGAKVEGADFYLVDLRRATYTPDQAEHFARCRAILADPA